MRKLALTVAMAFGLAVSPAAAQVCSQSGDQTVASFEAVKTAFLDGVTREGLAPLFEDMIVTDQMWEALLVRVPERYPSGFSSCETLVQRHDAPGLVQEIFVLNPSREEGRLYVYLAAILIDDALEVIALSYQTNPALILSELH